MNLCLRPASCPYRLYPHDTLCTYGVKQLIYKGFKVVRREGFEPPAFWSVGCLKGKSESFRLRFVLFTTVHSADFPLFPSNTTRFLSDSGSKLGQDRFTGGFQSEPFHASVNPCRFL